MKNKKILILLLLVLVPVYTMAVMQEKTNVSEYANELAETTLDNAIKNKLPEEKLIIYDYFYKKDEDNNIINNAEFKLRSINNKLSYDVVFDEEVNAYKYRAVINDEYNNLISTLNNNQANFVKSIKSKNDLINVYERGRSNTDDIVEWDVDCLEAVSYQAESKEVPIKGEFEEAEVLEPKEATKVEYSACNVYFPVIMFIEETKTPKGLEKETMVVTSTLNIYYEFNSDNDSFSLVNSTLNPYKELLKYDSDIDYTNLNEVANKYYPKAIEDYNKDLFYDSTSCDIYEKLDPCANGSCDIYEELDPCANGSCYAEKITDILDVYDYNDFAQSLAINNLKRTETLKSSSSSELFCTPIVVDKKGNSDVSINSYINNKEEVSLDKNDTVKIQVVLKNNGKAPSYNNELVSNVPDGVEYVSGSASDDGVYDSEKSTVTWNLEYLDAGKGHMFAYDVKVTAGNAESIYVTTSSLKNEENETPIISNEAKVVTPGAGSTDEVENPQTGDTRSMMIVIILIISLSVLYYFNTKKTYNL